MYTTFLFIVERNICLGDLARKRGGVLWKFFFPSIEWTIWMERNTRTFGTNMRLWGFDFVFLSFFGSE